MDDELIVFDVPRVMWKISGVNGKFTVKSKPFHIFGIEMKLKLIHYLSSSSGYTSLIVLKNKECAYNLNLQVSVGLGKEITSSTYCDSYHVNFSSSRESAIWHKTDSQLQCGANCGQRDFCEFFRQGYFFFISFDLSRWNPECITACQTTGPDLASLCPSNIGQDLSALYNNPCLSDVTIECVDGKVHAHRAILAARSKFFQDMFRGGPVGQPELVSFPDVLPSVMRQFLAYLYTGEVPDLNSENVYKLSVAADKFHVDALKLECADFMMLNSSVQDPNSSDDSASAAATGEPVGECLEKAILLHYKIVKDLFHTKEWQQLTKKKPEVAKRAFKCLIDEVPRLPA